MNILISIIVSYAIIIMIMSYDFNSKNADYLLVLGSKLIDNSETDTLISRIERAASYLEKYPRCKVIVSGGITEGNSVSEASIMYSLLVERNIEPERIIMEDKALNTYENFAFSIHFMDISRKIVICTSDYHVLRSKMLARINGYSVNSIYARSELGDLVFHLLKEEYLIIMNMFEYH